MNVLGLDWS